MSKNSFVFPSVLSYSRSIQPTIGYLYSTSIDSNGSEVDSPVIVERETLSATFSNYNCRKEIEKIAKGDKKGITNIQTADTAYLNGDAQYLKVNFSVSLLSNTLTPYSTNDVDAANKLSQFVKLYVEKEATQVLACAYLTNLASGRWLFRNDYGYEKKVTLRGKFNGEEFEESFTLAKGAYSEESVKAANPEGFAKLGTIIHNGLFNPKACVHLNISAMVSLYEGAEVFPSQEFTRNTVKTEDGHDVGKVLSSVELKGGKRHATMHSQKLGNAIRTIDTWYSKDAYDYPLAIEPFGVDQRLATSFRKKDNDFYTLVEKYLEDWIHWLQNVNSVSELVDDSEDMHFVIACLIRGGVYSGKGKGK